MAVDGARHGGNDGVGIEAAEGGDLGQRGRARISGEIEGFVKIVADKKYDPLVWLGSKLFRRNRD